ncbi:MAG: helix-turn-helix domain-containing protein [Clostridia bacterium]|nr:helix-turn-helix domain-containing protein [Clostridia bacterium]
MEYYEKLKELRTQNEYYQKDIASKIGVATNTYQSWERGLTQPDIFNLIKLSNVYNCSVDYLIGKENEEGFIVMNNDLTEDENALIKIIRQLSIKDKSLLYEMAGIMLKASKNSK